jgi:hypothetical protein
MTSLDRDQQKATVVLSSDEVGILNNALNEVCNALDIAEFSTRMGAELGEVQQLLHQLHALGVSMQDKAEPAQRSVGR